MGTCFCPQIDTNSTHLCEQQEVIEQEAVELLAALGFKEFPAVEELARPQTVGHRVEHKLLKETFRPQKLKLV